MSQPRQPNIILITTDQQRYDTIGRNAGLVKTPHLDSLAEQGVSFERPYINNTCCMPSRACIQTGRYTHQHGLRYMEKEIANTPGLAPWEETFMERLQVAGYDTGAVGKIHMKPAKGFDYTALTNGKGQRWTVPYGSPFGPSQLGDEYAYWLETKHPGAYAQLHEQRRQPELLTPKISYTNVQPLEEYIDYWITENAISFVSQERAADKPFFLRYGLCNPHGPIDPPKEYADLYSPEDIVLSELFTRRVNKEDGVTDEVMRRWIAQYYGLCTFVDDMIGKLVQALHDNDEWDNTLIIFTSDHGEMMGDFGRFGKAVFYEAVLRVPMIIKPPAHAAVARSVIPDLVELIDIAPTIMDYAGVRIPNTVQGASLRPVMEGTASGKEAVLCEYTANNQSSNSKCIRTDRYKYWITGPDTGGSALFDLQEDPLELHNLIDDPGSRSIRMEMQDRLLHQLMATEKPILHRK